MKKLSESELRQEIIKAISHQGFSVNGHVQPIGNSKLAYRDIQSFARQERILLHKSFISKNIQKARDYFINGKDLDPSKIELELREVKPSSTEEVLFKWWNLVWWSVPYQKAYGRQMRFIVWDRYHNAPFGLIGLQSPVLKMAVRDNYLNIPKNDLDIWVNRSMHAQRLGALPPYNDLIGGKFMAMALTCNEIRSAYASKYKGLVTVLKERVIDSNLLFSTTTSAFGKSSIYNRLKYGNDCVANSIGYTQGSGTFHISNELYQSISSFMKDNGHDVLTTFGNGPSRKLKIIYKACSMLDLPNYSYHNIKREFFIFPNASNIHQVIAGAEEPLFYDRPFSDLTKFWKERWAIPRSLRTNTWSKFNPDNLLNDLEANLSNI